MSTVDPATTLYFAVKSRIKEGEITVGNFFDLVVMTMEQVERFRELGGSEKKALVVRVVNQVVEDMVAVNIENDFLRIVVSNFLDQLIETLITVDGGAMHINMDKKKLVRKLMPCCFK